MNKPQHIPTVEELEAEEEKFNRENVTLEAQPLTTGKLLAQFCESNQMDMFDSGFEMGQEADQKYAALVDFSRDYRDCAECYAAVEKLEVNELLQGYIDDLKVLGISLCYATRKLYCKSDDPNVKPVPFTGLFVMAFPLGNEPKTFVMPREVGTSGL